MHGLPPLPLPHGELTLHAAGLVLGGLSILWAINLYNFMDGVDGLAALQAVFVSGAAIVIIRLDGAARVDLIPLLALLGASMAFLLWNLPPAKIFLGDVGSGFIGFAIAAIAFTSAARGTLNLWAWLILNGSFFADASTTLLIRLLRGERVYQAHRSHVYQRLALRWHSHIWVALCYFAVNVLWCLPWAIESERHPAVGLGFACLAILPLCLLANALGAGSPAQDGTAA
jgi:Fuc2NAc and GlcNAc transferase